MSQRRLVLLSGPPYAGKTTIARLFAIRGALVISVRDILRNLAGEPLGRRQDLQVFGASIETDTGGEWLADAVRQQLDSDGEVAVVDAVRTERQLASCNRIASHRAMLVHVTASETERRRRFEDAGKRDVADRSTTQFAELDMHDIDREADSLRAHADVVVDTTSLSAEAAFSRIARALHLSTP